MWAWSPDVQDYVSWTTRSRGTSHLSWIRPRRKCGKRRRRSTSGEACLQPLPGRGRLDVAWIGAAGAGGLSLPGQERLTRASVGESVFSRHLLQGHTLKKMDGVQVCEDKLHYPKC